MDKVKEILKKIQPHQFWIMLGIALLLPSWAWWSTTEELVAKTKDRETKIKGAISALPKTGERNANDNWIEGVRAANVVQEAQLKKAWHERYDRQQKLIKWPERLGFTDPDKATDPDLARYNNRYPIELEMVRQIPNTIENQYLEPGPVNFPKEVMPKAAWTGGQLPPTILQMKNAQEDLWLLASLLRSIRRTNGSAKTTLKAAVREIRKIRVRGGALSAAAAPAAPQGEGGGEPTGRRMLEGGGGPPAAAAAAGPVDAAFDPGEEMGPDPEAGGAAARPGAEFRGGGGGEGGAPPADPAAAAQAKRYLDELPQAKKRGFYLEVVLEQGKLPDLLVQLSKSEWPVRILHVNLAELRPDPLVPPADEGVPAAARMAAIKAAEAAGAIPGAGFPPGPGVFPPVGQVAPPGFRGPNAPNADDPAMADPYLAVAAVSGYIVIYNPPPVPPAATGDQAGQAAAVQQVPGGQNPVVVPPTGPSVPDAAKSPPAAIPQASGTTIIPTPSKTGIPPGVPPAAESATPLANSTGTSGPSTPSKTGVEPVATPPAPTTKAGEAKASSTNPNPPKK